jgi:hypothetical protein
MTYYEAYRKKTCALCARDVRREFRFTDWEHMEVVPDKIAPVWTKCQALPLEAWAEETAQRFDELSDKLLERIFTPPEPEVKT